MTLSVLAAALAFGVASAALALMGVGVPFLAAALGAAACAGVVMHAAAGRLMRPVAADSPPAQDAAASCRIRELEGQLSALRHDLRGVLSPALMMTDRLLSNDDPRVRRAGEAVVRSVERATELLAASKPVTAPTVAAGPAVRATLSR